MPIRVAPPSVGNHSETAPGGPMSIAQVMGQTSRNTSGLLLSLKKRRGGWQPENRKEKNIFKV